VGVSTLYWGMTETIITIFVMVDDILKEDTKVFPCIPISPLPAICVILWVIHYKSLSCNMLLHYADYLLNLLKSVVYRLFTLQPSVIPSEMEDVIDVP